MPPKIKEVKGSRITHLYLLSQMDLWNLSKPSSGTSKRCAPSPAFECLNKKYFNVTGASQLPLRVISLMQLSIIGGQFFQFGNINRTKLLAATPIDNRRYNL